MSKKVKSKKKTVAVTILRERPCSDANNQLDLAAQKKALELYCRDKRITIEDYHFADESYVHWGDFRSFLNCIKEESFKPDIILFTSWAIIAPLLDRFPQTFQILETKGIKLKSIKQHILKHALDK